jgi:hypothetical protein
VNADAVLTFWTAGDLRCVLVTQSAGPYVVRVIKGVEVLCSAFIDDPIETEGPAAAARLKVIFVDRAH